MDQSAPTRPVPPPTRASSVEAIPAHRQKTALGIWFVLLGVVLPLGTLGFELFSHSCAEVLFDPIPTWLHVALIALVPLANLAAFTCTRTSRCSHPRVLTHLASVAFGVALVYTVLFVPFMPFGIIGIMFYGLGLLPLVPLISLVCLLKARRALRASFLSQTAGPPLWQGAFAAIAIFGAPVAWDLETRHWLEVAVAGNPEQQERALHSLRWFGHHEALLISCYGASKTPWSVFFSGRESTESFTREQAQDVFYRVTGQAYNARPAPASVSIGRRGGRLWNWDAGHGGEQVAGKVLGLTLEHSEFEATADPAALTGYGEWTLVFKNVAANQSEARAQIQLPPDSVVSRLTLWIDGEPREAAFGSRAQVRAAYREVAVQQRRDPVLVTTSGRDRVLMQCFPVPPGGEMKVRLGVTVPLRVENPERATLMLPRILETNFESAQALVHQMRLAAPSPAMLALTDAELQQPHAWQIARRPSEAREIVSDDPTDPTFVIRQRLEEVTVAPPTHLALVLDGSQSMRSHWHALIDTLRPYFESSSRPASLSVHLAGDRVLTWDGQGDLLPWLAKHRPSGGCDNVPALLAGWDRAAAQAGSAILWIHGPQPVALSGSEVLAEHMATSRHKPQIFELSVTAAPTRVLEDLADYEGWQRADLEPSPVQSLAHLLQRWSGSRPTFTITRDRMLRAGAFADAQQGDRHVARLWGLDEVNRLRLEPESLDAAVKLALSLQLVTPVTGAVVLERQEQYDRHGLQPVSGESVPTVPEPGTAIFLAAGAALLACSRRRRGQ